MYVKTSRTGSCVLPSLRRKNPWRGGEGDSDGKVRHNLLAWFINPATNELLSPFTARTPDSLASSMACCSTRNVLLPSGSRPPVSTSLVPDPDTATSHTSPIDFDLFRYFGGGGPSHRLRTNLSCNAQNALRSDVHCSIHQRHNKVQTRKIPEAKHLQLSRR